LRVLKIFGPNPRLALVLTAAISIAAFFIGCSHFNSKNSKAEIEQSKKWLTDYKSALSDNKVACTKFTELSQKEKFILAPLAGLRAQLVCLKSESEAQAAQVTVNPDLFWLNSLSAEVEYKKQLKLINNPDFKSEDFLKSLKNYIGSLKIDNEKLSYLKEALELSRASKQIQLSSSIEAELFQLAPRFVKNPMPDLFSSAAKDYLKNREFNSARKYFERIKNNLNLSFDIRLQAFKQWRNSYRIQQDRPGFIRASKKLSEWPELQKSSSALFEALSTYARALWTDGQNKKAQNIFLKIEGIGKNDYGDEIEWLRGRMAEEKRDFSKAAEHFEKARNLSSIQKTRFKNILWSRSWILYKNKQYLEAANSLDELSKVLNDPQESPKILFWQAMALSAASNKTEANKIWQQVTELDPIGYYGALAHFKLKKPFPSIEELKKTFPKVEQKFVSQLQQEWIPALKEVGEYDVLNQIGLYLPVFIKWSEFSPRERAQYAIHYPEFLFPLDFAEIINQTSQKFEVDPAFVKALIRQESAFNPHARSPVDAIGLMQVLPDVARKQFIKWGSKLEKKLDNDSQFETLFDPNLNIFAGTSLLYDLNKKYKDQFILVVAGYNANANSIEKWLNTRWNNDPIEFIEDIPFEETQNYIKLVMRNFILYKRFSLSNESLLFPEELLKLSGPKT
jgi:soluble lytic murein transglycosylase